MNSYPPFEKIDVLIFDIIDFSIKKEFGWMPFIQNHYQLEMYVKMETHAMVAELRAYLMSRRHESETTYDYVVYEPSTWWQHFKDQYFRGRLLKWFPVQRRKRTFSIPQTVAYNICPHANIAWDKSSGPHVTFMYTGEYYPFRASNSKLAVP